MKTLHPYDLCGRTISYGIVYLEHEKYKKISCKVPKSDKLQTYELKIGSRSFLVLDCYGNDSYSKELEERIFHSGIRDRGYTFALDKNNGAIYLCMFHSENKQIKIFLNSIDRILPKKFLSRIDQLKYQKRPFRIGFSDIDLLKFIDHDVGYGELKDNFLVLLKFNKFQLEIGKDFYRLLSNFGYIK